MREYSKNFAFDEEMINNFNKYKYLLKWTIISFKRNFILQNKKDYGEKKNIYIYKWRLPLL